MILPLYLSSSIFNRVSGVIRQQEYHVAFRVFYSMNVDNCNWESLKDITTKLRNRNLAPTLLKVLCNRKNVCE